MCQDATMSSASASPRVYGGVDAAERTAGRRSRFLAAGLDLLGTGGLAVFGVRAVCERAGLAARYFYESFPSLDALTVAVFDGVVDELIREGTRAIATAPPDAYARLRAALGCALHLLADDPRKGHVVLTLAMGSPPLAGRRLEGGERIARLVAATTAAHRAGGPPADSRRLLRTAHFLVGGFSEVLTAWLRDPDGTSREQLLDDVTQLFLAVIATLE
jgi:AcrR family transcriptional regulator